MPGICSIKARLTEPEESPSVRFAKIKALGAVVSMTGESLGPGDHRGAALCQIGGMIEDFAAELQRRAEVDPAGNTICR